MSARKPKGPVGAKHRDLGERAPITEALIDLQASLPADVDIDRLEQLHQILLDDYPDKKMRRRWTHQFTLDTEEQEGKAEDTNVVDGCLFSSRDNRQIVQFRLDGFTFSRLSPYQGWDRFLDEAQRLWKIYREELKPNSVRRLALRYINKIELGSNFDLDHYFTVGPRTPPGLPERFSAYSGRLQIEDEELRTTAIVTLAIGIPPGPEPYVTLDIDTFRFGSFAPDTPEIWSTLERLRVFKNRIFFGSITDQTTAWLVDKRAE